jgi:hypothetical protein
MDDIQTEPIQVPKPRTVSAGPGPMDASDIDDSPFGSPSNEPPSLLDDGAPSTSDARLSRKSSFSADSSYQDDWDPLPPLDRIGVLDILDSFTLPQQLEKLQKGLSRQTSKVRRSREAFKSRTQNAKDRMVEEWRRRVPSADEQLDRYKKRMRTRFDKLGKQWTDTKTISLREKISFICGVMNIFISGYLIGGYPEYFHIWYTVQLLYFMPIRFFTYHRRGYHYFLADLCYFVNFLLTLSIWVFPNSKRLFMSAYCLAFGNNAVAIIMWRNSLVFHSFDKVTSLFIHIMPCATLHCVVHLFDPDKQRERFPAIWTIKNSPPGSPTAYANVISMLAWSSVPYACWQLSYYFLITVRRRAKIEAGRPTSFTWLRKSYSKTWIGKLVLSLPSWLQEPAFMLIQYAYAVLTMLPCPLWFIYRWASASFLMIVFAWSIYNGSTYYIDVFGKRFQKELEAMKTEMMKWQSSPELMLQSPLMTPYLDGGPNHADGTQTQEDGKPTKSGHGATQSVSVDQIPLLDETVSTGVDAGSSAGGATRGRT